MREQATQAKVDEIWELFKETDNLITRIARESEARFRENEATFRENEERSREREERSRRELDKRFSETDAALRRLEGQFGSQWGKMLEALVEPGALRLFQEQGVDVHRVYRRAESQVDGQTMEIDLILENDTEIVVVEVKSTLKVYHVDELLADLAQFTYFFPRYAGQRIYGAVAGLTFAEEADRYAYHKGLYVVSVTGDGLTQIRNDKLFTPRDFGMFEA